MAQKGAVLIVVALAFWASASATMCSEQRFSATVLMKTHKDAAIYLSEVLDAVSTPGSPYRGSYLSAAQVGEIMRSNSEMVAAIQRSLSTRGFEGVKVSPWGDVLSFNATFGQLKRAFPQLKCGLKKNGSTKCDIPRLPVDLQEHAVHMLVAPIKPVLASCSKPSVARARRDSGIPAACLPAPEVSSTIYTVPFFPPPPAYLVEDWTTGTGNMSNVFSATFGVLPRCFSPSDKTFFLDQFTNSLFSAPEFRAVSKDDLCGSNTSLTSVTVVFTDVLSGQTVGGTVGAAGCVNISLDVCNYDSLTAVSHTLVYCGVQVHSSKFVSGNQYNLTVSATVSNGSTFTAPVCVYSNTTACVPKIFVPQAAVLPDHVRSMYSVPLDLTAANTHASQAVVTVHAPGIAYYDPADINQFQQLAQTAGFNDTWVSFVAAPDLTAAALAYAQGPASAAQRHSGLPVKNISVHSQSISTSYIDQTLTADIEWIAAVGKGAQTYVFHSGYFSNLYDIAGGNCFFCEALDVLMAVQYGSIVPSVLTISSFYVEGCEGDGKSLIRNYTEGLFKTFGTMGVSVISASGDQGAHPSCDVNPINAGQPANSYEVQCALTSTYPASSIYVTAVGATQHLYVNTSMSAEVPASLLTSPITSGGGFSAFDYRAGWQDAAITNYLNKTKDSLMFPAANHIQQNHSGYPDVALLATPMQIVVNGQVKTFSGTAAAAATFAGMITLINAELERNGKARLGFLNPFLYSAPANVFYDISVGDNTCAGMTASQAFCCRQGYPAAPGWDPITGLGSINFTALLNYALSTQNASSNATVSPFTPAPVFPTRAVTTTTTHTTTHTTTGTSSGSSFDSRGFLIAMPVLLGLGVAASFIIYAMFFAPKTVTAF